MNTHKRMLFVLTVIFCGALLLPQVAEGQGPLPSQPEMDVDRATTPIGDGDTDTIGNQNGAFSLTYTIQNTGAAPLNLTGTPAVQVTAQIACTITVSTQPTTPVAPGGSTTFVVSGTPTGGPGAMMHFNFSIANDDANENPYNFGVTGSISGGPPPPPPGELAVDRAGTPVADGGMDNVGSQTAQFNLTYTIQNTGQFSGILLTGSPLVSISTQVNCTAQVTTQPSTPIAQSSSTTFTLSCTPSGTPFSFNISIDNTDLDENPYNWNVLGTAPLAPEMDVDRGGTGVPDGSTDAVGSLPAGSPSSLTYTINNTGSGTPLPLRGSFGGQTNCTVTATTQASPTVAAGGSTTLVLSCTPTTGGSAFSFT
ncbi:MAG: hypothetical protein ACYTHM_09345, partial [Planctomycetota bacterium]